jgi:hypothetical protein
MLGQLSLSLDRLDGGTWTVPAVGVLAAGFLLVLVHLLVSWRHARLHTAERDSLLVGQAIGPAPEDRRSAARRPGKTVKVWITDANLTGEPFQGWIRDRSMGGLSITVYRPVEIDTIVSVRSTGADQLTPWIHVHVKRCAVQGDGHWELGCQFVRTPSYSQLLSFS